MEFNYHLACLYQIQKFQRHLCTPEREAVQLAICQLHMASQNHFLRLRPAWCFRQFQPPSWEAWRGEVELIVGQQMSWPYCKPPMFGMDGTNFGAADPLFKLQSLRWQRSWSNQNQPGGGATWLQRNLHHFPCFRDMISWVHSTGQVLNIQINVDCTPCWARIQAQMHKLWGVDHLPSDKADIPSRRRRMQVTPSCSAASSALALVFGGATSSGPIFSDLQRFWTMSWRRHFTQPDPTWPSNQRPQCGEIAHKQVPKRCGPLRLGLAGVLWLGKGVGNCWAQSSNMFWTHFWFSSSPQVKAKTDISMMEICCECCL